jgi:HTH-type transcriptional regulator/antitoxin HipB
MGDTPEKWAAELPLGAALRRARLARGLSQAELASAAGVTQGSISNYERGVMVPTNDTLGALARALDLDFETLQRAQSTVQLVSSPGDGSVARLRSQLLQTAIDLRGAAVWEHAADGTNGDLAFVHAAGNLVYVVLIDGAGTGEEAARASVVLAIFILGVLQSTPGVCWPAHVLEEVARFPAALGGPGQGAVLVAMIDRARRSLHHARSPGMPPPFLRDARAATSALQGHESRLGRFREGEITGMAENAMLLLATDGVANAARATGKPLWQSADIRTWVTSTRHADELAARVGKRALTGRPMGAADDMLVVALKV